MRFTKRFFASGLGIALVASGLFAISLPLAGADPAAATAPGPALASTEVAPLSAKERKHVEELGAATAEVLDECYLDTENERDPHYAPDWCDAKAAMVAKAVAKNPALAAEVIVYAAYEHADGPRAFHFGDQDKPPAKRSERRAWLAYQLVRVADRTVLVWRFQQLLERHVAKPAPDSVLGIYLLNELSVWTGWRVCQTREEFTVSENSCALSWREWLVAHAGEKPAQWQESAAAARLADLRSGDPARQSWALQPWHRLGATQALGPAHFGEIAWILHDALLPNKLKPDQADHFVELAKAYKCSTRCVLFPPPLAGRSLPPAPPTLAEGKPILNDLPARPVDLTTQWTMPEVPKALKDKIAKGSKLLQRYYDGCMALGNWHDDDGGAGCYEQTEALEGFKSDPVLAAHTLARGYFALPHGWWSIAVWHYDANRYYEHDDEIVRDLATKAHKPTLVDYLLESYQQGMRPGKKAGQAMAADAKAQILTQLAELTMVPLCGAVPWTKDNLDPCFGQWSAWWAANRHKDADSWEAQGEAMVAEDLKSADMQRRYQAVANYVVVGDLAESADPDDIAVRWSLRDVLLDPATPADVATAFDGIAAERSCNFRCIAYPPPLPGRTAPSLPAMVAKSAKTKADRGRQPVAAVPEGASAAQLAKTCRQLLMRMEAEQALEVCGKGVAKDPKHAELQIALAWATLDARDAGAAVVAAQKAVTVAQSAGQAEAQLVLGAALTAAGEKEKSRVVLTIAAASRSTALEAKARLAMLDGKLPSGKALPRLTKLVHCASQAKSADPAALLVRRGWVAGLPAWQAAVKDVPVGRCGG